MLVPEKKKKKENRKDKTSLGTASGSMQTLNHEHDQIPQEEPENSYVYTQACIYYPNAKLTHTSQNALGADRLRPL